MSGATGVVYQDLVAGSAPPPATYDQNDYGRAATMRQEPTESHALAMQTPEVRGLAQIDHGAEVKDLGWNEPKENIASPLVGGLNNEELWLLIRRFNKVRFASYGLLDVSDLDPSANVPRKGSHDSRAWQSRYEYCRGGRVLA